jgi:hypothetical protein
MDRWSSSVMAASSITTVIAVEGWHRGREQIDDDGPSP